MSRDIFGRLDIIFSAYDKFSACDVTSLSIAFRSIAGTGDLSSNHAPGILQLFLMDSAIFQTVSVVQSIALNLCS